MSKTEKAFGAFFMLILCLIASFVTGRKTAGTDEAEEQVRVVTDTLIVRDTIVQSVPVSVYRRVIDSILIPITDTLMLRDTMYVYLPKEQVVWTDSLCRVYASGYKAQVDSVEHFRERMTITKEVFIPVKDRRRWGIGIQAGYGAGSKGLHEYMGIGLQYNLITF